MKILNFSLFVVFFLSSLSISAQNPVQIQMGSSPSVSTCFGTFFDPGGNNTGGNPPLYPANDFQTMTICPGAGSAFVTMAFYNWTVGQGDTLWVYNGSSTAAPLIGVYDTLNDPGTLASIPATNPNGCLTLVWKSDASGNGFYSAQVHCDPPCQAFSADFTTPFHQMDTNYTIKSCQEDSVILSAYGIFPNNNTWYNQNDSNVTFIWIFSDSVVVDTGQTVGIPIDTVGGAYRISLLVTDSNGCQITEAIIKYIMVSTTPSFGNVTFSDTTVCYNDSTTLNLDVISPQWSNADPGFIGGSIALPDGSGQSPGVYTSPLTIAMFNAGDTISATSNINHFFLNMEHSFLGDLDISISCPNGSSLDLKSFPGGGGRWLGEACDGSLGIPGNGWNYYWPSANPALANMVTISGACLTCNNPANPCGFGTGTSLDSTSYTAMSPWGNLVGCPLNGTWSVTVVDQWAIDDGTLFSWGIDFDSTILPQTIITYQPQKDSMWITYDSNLVSANMYAFDSITFAPIFYDTTVNCSIFYQDDFGCVYDTAMSFYIEGPCVSGCRLSGYNPGMFPVGCFGDSTGYAYIEPDTTLLTGPFIFYWVDASGDTVGQSLTPKLGADTLFNLPAATFQAHVIDSFGCIDITTIAVGLVPQMFNYSNGIQAISCNSPQYCDGVANVISNGGSAPYSYLWSSNETTQTAAQLCGGSNWVEVTDTRGCKDTVNILVPVPDSIQVTAWGSDTMCIGSIRTLSSLATGGNGVFSYLWTTGDSTPTAQVSPIFTQSYIVVATDSNLCPSDTDTVTIYVRDPLSVTVNTPDTICPGDTAIGIAYPAGGDSNFFYQWADGSAGKQAFLTPTTSRFYAVTVSDGCGTPPVVDSVWVQVGGYPPIKVATTGNDTLCEGETVLISAQGGGGIGNLTYTWDNGLGSGQQHVVTPTVTTTYTVSVVDACLSIPGTASLTLSIGQFEDILIHTDSSAMCSPGEFIFNVDSIPERYQLSYLLSSSWNDIRDTLPIDISLKKTGCYDLKLKTITAHGCESIRNYPCFVEVWPNPIAEFTYTPTHPNINEPGVEFRDLSSGADSLFWIISTGDTLSEMNFHYQFPNEDSGTYFVKQFVSNNYGCADTTAMRVKVEFETTFFVPTGFSPNGDGLNDFFGPVGFGFEEREFHMQIFNRWGELVYETTDITAPWDGTINGVLADAETYAWTIYYSTKSGLRQIERGQVNLIR
mgnify:CR=1 FL=1